MAKAKTKKADARRPPPQPPRLTWKQRLLLVAFGLGLLLLAEGVVRVAGLAPVTTRDPFLQAGAGERGYEPGRLADGTPGYVCPWINPEYTCNFQPIPRDKAPGELRIFVFGGSSAVGYSYDGRLAFAHMLEAGLRAVLPQRRVRVFNVAQNAIEAGTCLRLMHEMAAYQADIFVVYSGNNEYNNEHVYRDIQRRGRTVAALQKTARHAALYRLLERALLPARARVYADFVVRDRGVSAPPYSPAERDAIRNNYAYVIESMADFCNERGIALALCTVAVNESDFPPHRSAFAPTTTEEQRRRWLEGFAEALGDLRAERYEAVLAKLDALAKIDASRADLYFIGGKTLAALGRYGEARVAFAQVLDLDNVCHRAPPAHNAIVRKVASEKGATLVDVVAALHSLRPDVLLGNEFFWDHCHPRVKTHHLIAFAVAAALFADERLPEPPLEWQSTFNAAVADYIVSVKVTPAMQARALRSAAQGWLTLWTHHRTPDDLLRQSGAALKASLKMLDDAIELDPTVRGSHFLRGVVLAQFGERERAVADWRIEVTLRPTGDRMRPILDGLIDGSIATDHGFEQWLFVANEMVR